MPTSRPIVGRLAPSPTGGLHVGHARTFLLAWLSARRAGGRVVLRIEDLDVTRARAGMAEAAVEDLRWLGLDWDEGPDVGGARGPYVQSERGAVYSAELAELKARELVYPCTCTRAEIRRMASAPHAEDEEATYPGTCKGRSAADAEELETRGLSYAWRFRVRDEVVEWTDGARGEMGLNPARHGGDFVVARSNGGFGYQLAVVVDDAAMGVTEVVRGDDLVASTPRQLLLYEALGLEAPRFAHVRLVVDAEGRRLAKRDGAVKLATLRAEGVEPGALLAKLLGLREEARLVTPRGLVGREINQWLADGDVVWRGLG